MRTDPKEYCLLICRRIQYFLCLFYSTEIVRMEAEFYQDDNGKIWFAYATKILVQEINLS
jgi:hypothetical protein